MSVENATYISGLNPNNPQGPDSAGEGDEQIRLLKGTVQNTFPTANRAFYLSAGAEYQGLTIPVSVPTYNVRYEKPDWDNGCLLRVDAGSAAKIVQLPAISLVSNGFSVGIQKDEAGPYTVAVLPATGETLPGGNSAAWFLWNYQETVWFVASNGKWYTSTQSGNGWIDAQSNAAVLTLDWRSNNYRYVLGPSGQTVVLPRLNEVPPNYRVFLHRSGPQLYFTVQTQAPDFFSYGVTTFRVMDYSGFESVLIEKFAGAWRCLTRRRTYFETTPPNSDGRYGPHYLGQQPTRIGYQYRPLTTAFGYGLNIILEPVFPEAVVYADETNIGFYARGLTMLPNLVTGLMANAVYPDFILRLWAEV